MKIKMCLLKNLIINYLSGMMKNYGFHTRLPGPPYEYTRMGYFFLALISNPFGRFSTTEASNPFGTSTRRCCCTGTAFNFKDSASSETIYANFKRSRNTLKSYLKITNYDRDRILMTICYPDCFLTLLLWNGQMICARPRWESRDLCIFECSSRILETCLYFGTDMFRYL